MAWPQFEARLPSLLVDRLHAGRSVGFAIGDCDELKAYVEAERVQDPSAWGHQAGNKVMAQLGGLARWWLAELNNTVPAGVLATFGGDEVIAVLDVTGSDFGPRVADLRDRLCQRLPVTVSFAYAVLTPDVQPAAMLGDAWPAEWTSSVIGRIDRTLFGAKRARRENKADVPLGFAIESDTSTSWTTPVSRPYYAAVDCDDSPH